MEASPGAAGTTRNNSNLYLFLSCLDLDAALWWRLSGSAETQAECLSRGGGAKADKRTNASLFWCFPGQEGGRCPGKGGGEQAQQERAIFEGPLHVPEVREQTDSGYGLRDTPIMWFKGGGWVGTHNSRGTVDKERCEEGGFELTGQGSRGGGGFSGMVRARWWQKVPPASVSQHPAWCQHRAGPPRR